MTTATLSVPACCWELDLFLTHPVPAATPDVPKEGGALPEKGGEGQGEPGGTEAGLEAAPGAGKRWGSGRPARWP